MRNNRSWRFVLPLLLLSAISALLWTAFAFAHSYDLFRSKPFISVFYISALISTAFLAVFLAATATVRVGFTWRTQQQPTELQRKMIVVVLTFVAIAIILWLAGFNPTAIFATSAIVTAIVALSAQAILGSLIAGLALHGVIKTGDSVLLDGEPVEITSHHWRSVIASRTNGTTIVVPNIKLSDGTLQILGRDLPMRTEVKLSVPTEMPPHRVHKIVSEVLEDFPELDPAQSIAVLPLAHEPDKAMTSYRVRFWTRHYSKASDIEGRVIRRFWYRFRREGVVPAETAVPRSVGETERYANAVRLALRSYDGVSASTLSDGIAQRALDQGEVLLFDEGEQISFPERSNDSLFILLEGQLVDQTSDGSNGSSRSTNGRVSQELTRAGWLAIIERALAQRIGPYASHATREVAASGISIAEICEQVANEVDDPAERQAFLDETQPKVEKTYRPGFLFPTVEKAQRVIAMPTMRAEQYAVILAVPKTSLASEVSSSN
jgi:small-conductance mechanosensitive channel